MGKLSKEKRDAMPDSDFAVPETRDMPLYDAEHVKMAWNMVDRTKGLTESQRKKARERILHKAKELGVETNGWDKGLIAKAEHLDGAMVIMQAMSLQVPEAPDHPNRLPFSGVLTRIDRPSDKPPGGSKGKKVILTRSAAEAALHTLLGMSVDMTGDLAGHNARHKIGLITEADIEGDAILIKGFLYAADFPDETAEIQRRKDVLGFSWEIMNITVADPNADPMVIVSCVFTGAAILQKDKAAYTTTSLAASAGGGNENDGELLMTKEIMEAIAGLSEAVKGLGGRIEKVEASSKEALDKLSAGEEHRRIVEPHAKALEACGDAMAAAGIGGHATRGHVMACHAMAEHLRASAAEGHLANEWGGMSRYAASADNGSGNTNTINPEVEKQIKELKDANGALETKIKDLQAAAGKATGAQPERKTLSPQINALIAKAGIELPSAGDAGLSIVSVDKALSSSNLSIQQRMEVKNNLNRAGILNVA